MPNLDDLQWFARLTRRRAREAQAINGWWNYYEGDQPLYYVAKILEEQQDRFPPLIINWPAVVVDGIDDRCTVEGFYLNGADNPDDDLWDAWQANDLDDFQSENHVASLTTGVSYVMVGPGDDYPLITVESPETVTVEIDPRTRRVVAGMKVWQSDAESPIEDRAALYLPSDRGLRIIEFENGKPAGETASKWMLAASKMQTNPNVPIVPFLNQQRARTGRSEIKKLKPVVDAVNQVATNMLAAVEHHAMPRKWALGVSEKNFVDPKTGEPLPAWKIAAGAVWANPFDPDNPDAKPTVGQFPASDMRNFIDVCTMLSRFATGLYGMPPHLLGFNVGDNPAAADGVRASEDSWVRRIERRQTSFGSGYERVGSLTFAVMGRDPKEARRMETHWRNPATPTQTAKAQAAVTTFGAGITDLRQARMDYGYSLAQIKAMEEREAQASETDPVLRAARSLTDVTSGAPASGN